MVILRVSPKEREKSGAISVLTASQRNNKNKRHLRLVPIKSDIIKEKVAFATLQIQS